MYSPYPNLIKNVPYVYTFAYPVSMGGNVFYIGKGINYRINQHENEVKAGKKEYNPRNAEVIRDIWRHDENVVKTIVAYFDTHEEACKYEIDLIRQHGRHSLTNMTDGGDGMRGVPLTEEHRQKLIESNRNRVYTPEMLQRMSEISKTQVQTDEKRRKNSEASLKMWQDPVTRRKLQIARSRPFSAETRQRMRAAQLERSRKKRLGLL